MWQIFLVLSLVLSTKAIKVPVDNEENITENTPVNERTGSSSQPIYYEHNDDNIDSYLVPPDPHKPEELYPDDVNTPATHLIPPSAEKQIDYYTPTNGETQSDWYPIQKAPIKIQNEEAIPILVAGDNQSQKYQFIVDPSKPIGGEKIRYPIPAVPAQELEPPQENAPNLYDIGVPSKDLEAPFEVTDNLKLPVLKTKQKFNPIKRIPISYKYQPEVEPTLTLQLTPPRLPIIYKNPTKLYPKKYGFKPVPIPVADFADGSLAEIPVAKPLITFNPVPGQESLIPIEDKKIYKYHQNEQKKKLKDQALVPIESIRDNSALESFEAAANNEQQTSESNFDYPDRNAYPAPLREAPPATPTASLEPAAGERTEFRMHGMKGPHSYQFGYDTGKGKNRQFRFEERDNDGHVRGHYGYVDKFGKLRVVNYDADPEHGFRADAPIGTDI